MLLPLEELDGESLAGTRLSVTVDTDGRRPFPFTIQATAKGRSWALLEGRTNPGTSWRHPWLEGRFTPRPNGDGSAGLDPEGEEAFFQALGEVLVPAAYAMISCDGHPEDLSALIVDVPPQCTRLGYLLWLAGARWYKVWYYPEGWREGNEKVQGNVPLDGAHEAKRTRQRREEIERFLGTELAKRFPACAKRGRRLLESTTG